MDIACALRNGIEQGAAFLVLPRDVGKNPSIMLLLGLRKWRREILCLSVVHAITDTLDQLSNDSAMSILFDCADYNATGHCEHQQLLLECTNTRLKLLSILNRNIMTSSPEII